MWEVTLFTPNGNTRQESNCTDVSFLEDGTILFKTEGGDYYRANVPYVCRKERE